MKKCFLLVFLLTYSLSDAKTCKSSCSKRIQNSVFTYSYSWSIPKDDLCTIVPWGGMKCNYSIAMNGIVFESGTCDGNDAVTC